MLQTKQELPDGQRTGDECVAVMSETGHKTISYIIIISKFSECPCASQQ